MNTNVRCTWELTRRTVASAETEAIDVGEQAGVSWSDGSTVSAWHCRVEARWHTSIGEANRAFHRGMVDQVTLGGGSLVAFVRATRAGTGDTRACAIEDCLPQFDRDGLAYVAEAARAARDTERGNDQN